MQCDAKCYKTQQGIEIETDDSSPSTYSMHQSKIILLTDTISKRELYRSVYYRTPPAYISISSVKGRRKPPCAVTETKKLKK